MAYKSKAFMNFEKMVKKPLKGHYSRTAENQNENIGFIFKHFDRSII
jgi:hypothetical protein